MSIKKFLISKVFFKNLGLAFAIGIGIIFFILIWLSIFTRHGQARPIPDFYGLNIQESEKLAKKKRLKIEIIDSVYTNMVPRGCVVEQNPHVDHKVKKNRRVVLTINALLPEMVVMPDLVGLSKRQASSIISTAGLEVGNFIYKSDLTVDFVLDQMIAGELISAGDTIEKGLEVTLVLGKGLSSRSTAIPELIGRNFANAKLRILGSSLTLGSFNFDKSIKNDEDSLNAFVFKQNPEYKDDARLQLGSAVYIWLTMDSTLLPIDSSLLDLSDTLLFDTKISTNL